MSSEGKAMASEQCPERTDIGEHEKGQPDYWNRFDANHDFLMGEIIKEEPIEIKLFRESRQEEASCENTNFAADDQRIKDFSDSFLGKYKFCHQEFRVYFCCYSPD
ncbi:hypothetical protein JTB14_023804 [Gonioctena quinquepunctata]|nr:hypothetical protein JTB14_023804 [Gonioctena quinquepunctata]